MFIDSQHFVLKLFTKCLLTCRCFLPWLSRTRVGKRNLLTITSSGSDTELHESPLMLADSFSIFHPSPSSSSRASRGRSGTGVRRASRHDEERRARETLRWCVWAVADRWSARHSPPPPPAPRAPEHRPDTVRAHHWLTGDCVLAPEWKQLNEGKL